MKISYKFGLQTDPLVAPLKDGLEKVITTVNWTLTATSDQVKVPEHPNPVDEKITVPAIHYSTIMYGSVDFKSPDPNKYTPFDQVTMEILSGWVESTLGEEQVDSLKKRMDVEIAAMIEADTSPATPIPMPLVESES